MTTVSTNVTFQYELINAYKFTDYVVHKIRFLRNKVLGVFRSHTLTASCHALVPG